MIKIISQIFENNKINSGRQLEVDLSRGFAAILIILCHVGLYLGNPQDTALYVFSDISGSEFGAPVFMAVMGISMVYSKSHTPRLMAKRGLTLFLGGYLLSAFRSLLPLLIFGNINEWTSVPAFFVVDILQLAGLSFLLIALFTKIKMPSWAVLLIALVMAGIGQVAIAMTGIGQAGISMPETFVQNEWAAYFINLFFPVTEWSCFPFFTWFFFPAFGLFFGDILVRCKNKNKLYGILLPITFCCVMYVYLHFHFLYPDYTSHYYGNNFYYMGIKDLLLTAGFVLFSLSFWHFSNKILPSCASTFLGFLSRNLNVFYVFTWIYISILMHLSKYFEISFTSLQIILLMIVLLAICAISTKVYLLITKRKSLNK